jgi:hypothetical protein
METGGTVQGARRRVKCRYVPVVVNGRLAFRYDPLRQIVEWQYRGEKHYIDLASIEVDEQGIDKSVS